MMLRRPNVMSRMTALACALILTPALAGAGGPGHAGACPAAGHACLMDGAAGARALHLAQGPGRAMPRAVLGITIARAAGNGPVDGVVVMGVTPGGPAEAAGLKPDDLLLSIDDESLAAASAREAHRRLIDFMSGVEPGAELRLRYRRAAGESEVVVAAGELDPAMAGLLGPGWSPEAMQRRHEQMMRLHGPFGGLELVALSPGLGRYFGTETGVLIVRASPDRQLALEDGDVILAIGGREPKSPGHALRILGSYEPGEQLTLTIMRDRKRRELELTMPAADAAPRPPTMRRSHSFLQGPPTATWRT